MTTDFTYSTVQVAEFYNVSQRTIRNWAADGMPKVKHGRFNLRAVNQWWADNIHCRTVDDKPEIEKHRQSYWQHRSRQEAVKADVMEKSVLPRDVIETSWGKRVAVLFSALEYMKQRLPPILLGKTRNEISKLINDEINEMQSALFKKYKNYGPVKVVKKPAKRKAGKK